MTAESATRPVTAEDDALRRSAVSTGPVSRTTSTWRPTLADAWTPAASATP